MNLKIPPLPRLQSPTNCLTMSYATSVGTCPMNEDLRDILSGHLNYLEDFAPKKKQIANLSPKKKQKTIPKMEKPKVELCPWHKRNHEGHKNNFGLMGQCLDCMEEMKNGRCEIDVKNFDFDIYWTVKKFWDKVDIKGPNECWHWIGSTKKNGTETQAYFPAPFFSAKTQSAARVAFWTSRGFTGKLRTFHKHGCSILCCNPLHLRLRDVESISVPTEIATVNLSYGNIFDHAKANQDLIKSRFEA